MRRPFRFNDDCIPIAILFLMIAEIAATESVPDCIIESPAWAMWLFPAFGFGGAGLSRQPLRGALIGLGIALVPAAVAGLLQGLLGHFADIFGLVPFLAILAVVAFHAIRETIRVR
ncbi:MAG TPA: hypothetical protein VHC22_12445 [Pirellulales bacterium]|nr:hypothetical protein [Pirellulales bacterium]